jgi:hypothetical protein
MNRRLLQTPAVLSIGLAISFNATGQTHEGLSSFPTEGHTVYHLRAAAVAGGQRGIIAAAYDGAVLAFTSQGKRLWIAKPGSDFPYDLCAANLDGDPHDEALVATAGGSLIAIDDDGSLLWSFNRTAPLFQVAVARQPNGVAIIITGGVGQELFALSPQGNVLGSLKTQHCIRHIRTGDFLGNGQEDVAVATASSGLNGKLSLLLVNPVDLKVRWKQENLGTFAHNSGKRFFSMLILDLNKDGRADILLSNSWGEHGRIYAFNHQGRQLFSTTDPRIPRISYRMNLLRHVKLADDEFVLGHFGHVLILYNLDGTCREVLQGPYSFADAAFDPATKTLYLGSAVSGGDEIVALRLDRSDWRQTYAKLRPIGRLAQIEQNMARLREQVAAFRPPAYQPPPRKVTVVGRQPSGRSDKHLTFLTPVMWSQKFTNQNELWCRDIDKRKRYDMTADQIVAAARKLESEGRDFILNAGHGHAVHFPLATFEKILAAAPRHLWGFEFAEVEGVDAHLQEVVEQIMLPLAEMCRARGKHIAFHNKNIFWNGTCYLPFWRKVLLNEKYQDVFVPALEETNCRTQELSLAGRIGLWQAGAFNRWSCRIVTDNANFDRMWEYAGHQVLSHHFRQLASTAALGADVFYNTIQRGPAAAQLVPFYDMLEKGIIHIPRREELLSLPEAAIGMASPPSAQYIQHGINSHQYRYPQDEQPPMVLDRLDCYWAGAPLADYDVSRYVYGAERRQCNFLPPASYGMVGIVPADTLTGPKARFRQILRTDGQYWYDDQGKRREAAAYKDTVLAALESAAKRLPVRVTGQAHWSVVRLDPTHVRVTLIDPGYLDPAERDATIVLQHLDGVACRDILSGENLPMDGGRIGLRIPAGTLRVIDIEHR